MLYSLFFPLLAGALGVLQNTLNKRFSEGLGLPITLLYNNIAILSCSLLLLLLLRFLPNSSLPDFLKQRDTLTLFSWKNALPGLFGFIIIFIAPIAIDKAGATKVFICVVAAQILSSLLWDIFVVNITVTPRQFIGAAIAFAGALIASF